MELHVYNVKARSQAGKIWVKDITITQKGESWKNVARELSKNVHILPENSVEGLESRGEWSWGYLSVYENTIKRFEQIYLAVQGRAQLEHSSHIVKVGVKTTC